MSNEYTPTTEQIRAGWVIGEIRDERGDDIHSLEPGAEAEFDRWPQATLDEARAESWDKCAEEAWNLGQTSHVGLSELKAVNPYRKSGNSDPDLSQKVEP